MSSQKIPSVGRINISRIADYAMTKTGVICRTADGFIVCHIPCAAESREKVIDALYDARHRDAPQIDFSFLQA